MKTITVNDREFAMIARAVQAHNDMMNDMIFDEVSAVDLFSREPIAVTPEQLAQLREELTEEVETLLALRGLMVKLGLEVNERGYSV